MASYEKNRSKFKVSKLILYIILIIFAVIYLYPLFWLIVASFKTNNEIFLSAFGFPAELQWVNFEKAWNAGHIGQYFLNSVIVVGTTLIVSLLINCMAAYAIASMKWKFLLWTKHIHYAWFLWKPAEGNGRSCCYRRLLSLGSFLEDYYPDLYRRYLHHWFVYL